MVKVTKACYYLAGEGRNRQAFTLETWTKTATAFLLWPKVNSDYHLEGINCEKSIITFFVGSFDR